MPLVKGLQDKVGKDKLAVLMLSVDLGYGETVDTATSGDKERMKDKSVSWPNVLLPHGFDDSQRLFNLDGYGLTLIGPDGIVRGVDLRPEDIKSLLPQILK